ncbi:MAG TPA: gamma-glutamyltransferase, partial [Pseudobdellovibrionaceae bacterium]|nr:gamma-glutamyltransferase [Pseudobdellovibrionaceae bacterium]
MKQKLFLLLVLMMFVTGGCQHPGAGRPAPSGRAVQALTNRKDVPTARAQGTRYAVSTQGRASTTAATAMFEAGGNIIDAWVAASFTLAVERPQSTGIGGGGFLIFYEASTKRNYAIDFRERAPLKATKNMFLDKKNEPDPRLSQDSILSVGVPGLVAGLYDVHQKFGKLPWAKTLEPAIRLAEEGFPVYAQLAEALKERSPVLAKDLSARAIFLDEKGEPWKEGHVLVQKDLARTLSLIARRGKKGFYEGPVKASFLRLSKREKGVYTEKDFENVRVVWREPIMGTFNGYKVVSMPPPSSGGIHILQFLNFFEREDLKNMKPLSTEAIHLAASSLQQAFADRAVYLGDPDFVKMPVNGLISKEYSKRRHDQVPRDRARKSQDVKAGEFDESTETTHLSIIDADGNAVSSTQTINGWMGSGIVVPGTGVVLNNEMDDFSAKPGASNLFGAIGSEANSVQPMKTPVSSMSPTILFQNGEAVLALGAPGGTRIISCVAQTILNYAGFNLSLNDSVGAVRYHHQWKPDVLFLDPPGPGTTIARDLEKMGHQIKIEPIPCAVMAVAKEGKTLKASSDPRD